MKFTLIEWATHTYNPWEGCTKKSDGCANCYAKALVEGRWGRAEWGPGGVRRRVISTLKDPYKWHDEAVRTGTRPRVFCASLADVFDDHASIQQEWRDDLWKTIRETPALVWLILTKRPENFARYLPADWNSGAYKHVCLMVSVENQAMAEERIPILLQTKAYWRGLSVEPLLGPVDLSPWIERLDWVIVGGESGSGARPMNPAWVRSIRDLCRLQPRVRLFFKQWGNWTPEPIEKADKQHVFDDGETVWYRRDKVANGHLLDGKVHQRHPFPKKLNMTDKLRMERLTPDEQRAWRQNLKIVRSGFDTFVQVGLALREIRDQRLYRRDFANWEEFCREMVGHSKTHANRTIQAAMTVEELRQLTPIGVIGDQATAMPLPQNESQVRELMKVSDPSARLEVWRRAVDEAHGKQITALEIQGAVWSQLQKEKAAAPASATPPKVPLHVRQQGLRLSRWLEIWEALERGDLEVAKQATKAMRPYI